MLKLIVYSFVLTTIFKAFEGELKCNMIKQLKSRKIKHYITEVLNILKQILNDQCKPPLPPPQKKM